MIDYGNFQRALKHLTRQNENRHHLSTEQPDLIREAVMESVIQRFETCYDCLWKVLKRYLAEELGLPDVPNSPKPVLRLAHESGLLPSEIGRWLLYADARVGTAHDYSGAKAAACLALTDDFVADAIALYGKLSGQPWT
jgi:nucleotidyltransferase substrate binding protein (TIGR01987 family)